MVTGRTGTLEYGALPMKYQENANTDGTNDASEYVIYRYADVIMLRAEAKNEIFGPDGGGPRPKNSCTKSAAEVSTITTKPTTKRK